MTADTPPHKYGCVLPADHTGFCSLDAMTPPPGPRTKSGQEYLDLLNADVPLLDDRAFILAIEAEAASPSAGLRACVRNTEARIICVTQRKGWQP